MDSTQLYTHKRLSDFVSDYTEYTETVEKEQSSPSTEQYKYFHFLDSPDGLSTTDVGRFNEKIVFTANAITNWTSMGTTNGLDAWRMNLANTENTFKQNERTKFDSLRQSGLPYKMMNMEYNTDQPITDLSVSANDLLYTMFNSDEYEIKSGVSKSFDTLMNSTNNAVIPQTGQQLIATEWSGMYSNGAGEYTFTVNSTDCKFFIWLGDHSICEYTSQNTELSNNVTTYTLTLTQKEYIPIRIQCIYLNNMPATFEIQIDKNIMKNNVSSIESVSTVDTFCNVPNAPPALVYCAFVSQNQPDFIKDKFLCFSMFDFKNGALVMNNYDNLTKFYNTFRKYLPNSLKGDYDYNDSNRLLYGIVTNSNIKYTFIVSDTQTPLAYSIYRLKSDPRLGHTYQINTKMTDNFAFPTHKFDNQILNEKVSYADSYREKAGYYPDTNTNDPSAFNAATDNTGVECKSLCNDNANCRYYFTYTSDGNSKCVINSNNVAPEFNSNPPINPEHPIDTGSSSIFMRNSQLDMEGNSNCGTFKNNELFIPIETTSNYSDTFKYAKYATDNTVIDTPSNIGMCNNPEYKHKLNEAVDVLYKDATYYQDGSWVEGFSQDKSKYTDAVDETSDVIRANLEVEKKYASKMEDINSNYNDLQDELIPTFNETKQVMLDNPKYDYAGNELLYFRTKVRKNIREKAISDNNELYMNSDLMYTLGTLTTVTLIAFAIMLARD